MLKTGPAKKVTIYINEDAKYEGELLHEAIMTYLMHKGVAGATATRAYAGFGTHQQLHTPRVEVMSYSLPVRIELVETAEKVDEVLPTLYEMVSEGLIEVQETTVVKLARRPVEGSEPLPHERVEGKAILLEVFLGEADRWHGEPLSEAIVKKLRMMEIAGATVSHGILGYGAKGHKHKRSFFHPMRDVPVVISVIDTPEKIAGAVEAIEAMMEDGLLVTREVTMTRLVRGRVGKEASDATG